MLQAKGQASPGWSKEGEVQSARRRSSHFTLCVQFVEEQQIFKCMVLWEFCSDSDIKTCSGCEKAATWNYGPV